MFQTYDKLLSTEILSKLKVTIGPKTGGWVPLIVFHSHDNVQQTPTVRNWGTVVYHISWSD